MLTLKRRTFLFDAETREGAARKTKPHLTLGWRSRWRTGRPIGGLNLFGLVPTGSARYVHMSPRSDLSDSRPPRQSLLFGAVAAVVMVAAIGMSTTFLASRPHVATYTTPVGGRETIQLADGSYIDLNTNTILRTRFENGQRSVEFVTGEALFQIKHDAAHPFSVLAAGHRVTDLGTKFLVREEGKRLKVALMEGQCTYCPL